MQRVRNSESGVILINVLIVVALASGIALLMLASHERSVAKLQRNADFAQAKAVARGAEAAVISALHQDNLAAPQLDHYREPWANTAQDELAISRGTLTVTVRDGQALFNLNALGTENLQIVQGFAAVLRELEIDTSYAALLAQRVSRDGFFNNFNELEDLGFTPQEIATLREITVMLPQVTQINLNTTPPVLFSLLINNRTAAARLLRRRTAQGFITAEDLAEVGVFPPLGTGLKSSFFWIESAVSIGKIQHLRQSLVQRTENGTFVIRH